MDEVHGCDEDLTAEIRALLAGGVAGPVGNVPPELWNADRLNRLLGEIDTAIAAAQYDRAVGLAYTSLEVRVPEILIIPFPEILITFVPEILAVVS